VDPCVTLSNLDFESGFSLSGGGYLANNWTEWEAIPGAAIGYDETTIVHGGAHSQRIRVGSTNATSGGVYQRIPVFSGMTYTVSVWVRAGDEQSYCYLGVDPAGGTNAASGVVWSSATTDVAWVQKTWTGTATANLLTVFFKVESSDITKRNGYFDDATPSGSVVPPLLFQRTGDSLTLTWSECPPARLEQTPTLVAGAPADWTTVTNRVSVTDGQKTVTLTPVGSASFYRLVLE
jgi:hypothetical protein